MNTFHFYKRRPPAKSYFFLILVSLELLMSFTFLGYLHIPPLSITFAYIPILISGCLFGVKESVILGFLFGSASMYKATAYYVMPADQIFSPLLSSFPLGSLILSIGTRIFFSLIIGYLFLAAKKSRHCSLWIGIIAALASKFHAFLVYSALGIFFPDFGYRASNAFSISFNDVFVSLFCLCLVEFLWKFCSATAFRRFYVNVSQTDGMPYDQSFPFRLCAVFLAGTLGFGTASMLYFAHRIRYMLNTYGLIISNDIQHDLLHLQIQFFIALLAIDLLIFSILVILSRYLTYNNYLEQLDSLTGVMRRKLFFQRCDQILKPIDDSVSCTSGWFLLIDIDRFKSINDTYGHPFGDKILKHVALHLKCTFSDCGVIGRMGGDEFAGILNQDLPREILVQKLDQFLSNIAPLLPAPASVTCSIGVSHFTGPQNTDSLYFETDKLLYKAKQSGRARYQIGTD